MVRCPRSRQIGGKGMLQRQEYNFVMNPDLMHMTMRNAAPNESYTQLKGI